MATGDSSEPRYLRYLLVTWAVGINPDPGYSRTINPDTVLRGSLDPDAIVVMVAAQASQISITSPQGSPQTLAQPQVGARITGTHPTLDGNRPFGYQHRPWLW